jgi:glutamate synthase (NADPH/NADH) large chain
MTGGKVVILGQTGRNFAAGMSGGVAYVYNPDGTFEENLNAEMVDLDELDSEDGVFLHDTIQAHVDATDSAVGQRVLSDWEHELKNFTKVMPRDFKKVLQAISDAEAAGKTGEDVDTAIMEAANA